MTTLSVRLARGGLLCLLAITNPLLAQEPIADTAKIGTATKKTIGTLIEMNAGDVACYLTLKDDQNVTFHEMAAFEICEQEILVGKRLALRYDPIEILADVCQGNPDCAHTKLALLVTEVQLIDEKKVMAADDIGPDGLSSKKLTLFLKALQSAVASDKPAAVARFIGFPLRVNDENGKYRSISAAKFASAYRKIFTPEIKAALLAQQSAELFRSWRGAMVGGGELWITGICTSSGCTQYEILLTAVNLPPTPPKQGKQGTESETH